MPTGQSSDPLEAALDDLYAVEPGEFVDARKRLAADLRAADAKGAAKSLLAARRPTTAAWALNQLCRRAPDAVEALLARSHELGAAQTGAMAGDRDALRDATRAQRDALAAATEAALGYLESRATEAFRAQIRTTLQAASSDESVADELERGRLVREVSGSTGFPDVPGLTLVPDLEPSPKPAPKSSRPKRPRADPEATPADASATGAKSAAEERAAAAERKRVERERAALEQAQRRLLEAESAWNEAQDEASAAEEAAAGAHDRVGALERDLDAARRQARAADERATQARREAARRARTATKLRTQADRLGEGD